MIRKSMIALAAVAALGLTAFGASDAQAKGKGGWHKGGGWHHGHHHHHGRHFHRGFRFGFFGVEAYPAYDCVKVVTRRGRVKLVCTY